MWTTLKTIKDTVIIFFNQAKAYDYKSYEKVIWRRSQNTRGCNGKDAFVSWFSNQQHQQHLRTSGDENSQALTQIYQTRNLGSNRQQSLHSSLRAPNKVQCFPRMHVHGVEEHLLKRQPALEWGRVGPRVAFLTSSRCC